MQVEGRAARRRERLQVRRDLADLVRRARGDGRRARRMRVRERAVGLRCPDTACEVITLVDRDDEERVALVDAVARQTLEERRERRVVVGELLLVVGLTGA